MSALARNCMNGSDLMTNNIQTVILQEHLWKRINLGHQIDEP